MLNNKPNVLFWMYNFPNYSETFINNQIVWLLDHNVNVLIYTYIKNDLNKGNFDKRRIKEIDQRIILKSDIFPKSKWSRLYKGIKILLRGLFSTDFLKYKRALNSNKYGYGAKSFKHLLFTHFLLNAKIDIVHAHFGPNGIEASTYKEIGLSFKLICTFHGYDIRLGDVRPKGFYDSLFKYSSKIISISNYNYEKLVSFGLDENKIESINNGVLVKDEISNKETNVCNILSVGRLVEEKAFHLALNALSLLKKEYPDIIWKYNIIGDGKLETELKELTKTLGLTAHVTFHLYQNSEYVRQKMLDSHFLLLSSINEALPTVILEAQALKLPVLATNVGDISSVVINNKTGFLTEANLKSIFEGLVKMFSHKDKWNEYGVNGYNIVKREFESEKQMLKLLDVYIKC
ncbi:glycosyltransferase family 4 protein [Formosa haliotis]|uniref:glycosyltransferase family 4 protein n=1 Tax=Formosa haliotis TaxID=1555194 RepID=UPI0008257EB1|nr:glycosyltransferase family 4 protein [Formosa haliotis]